MQIKKKVLGVVFRRNVNGLEFLALRNNSSDIKHGGDFWYVITGGVEGNENLADAIKREIIEETGLSEILNIYDMDTVYEYFGKNIKVKFQEYAFLVEVRGDVKKLNEEHVEYEWLEGQSFIKKIQWDGDDLEKLVIKGYSLM